MTYYSERKDEINYKTNQRMSLDDMYKQTRVHEHEIL